MRSALIAAAAASLFALLAACVPQYEPAPSQHPNPIIIREFDASSGVVTLDPSFGFSLYRGEQGVPRGQRAAGLGRAVAFNLADAMAEHLTSLGYDVVRSDSAALDPGARALIVSGTFRRIDEGHRRRVGAENSGVAVEAAIDFQVSGAVAQRLAVFQLDSRQLAGIGLAPQGGDVKIAAARLGAAIGRYVADAARLNKWPAASR
jgi:hypothetical protein